ncbi:MAG TPA: hypothetical protein VFQ53_34395 [Kofleriaceae bacterium]|nr:hypothetical protein [Kofleriaceae bacterium]
MPKTLRAILLASLATGCVASGGLSMGGSARGTAGGPGPSSSGGGETVASGNAPAGHGVPQLDDFSFEVHEYTGDYTRAWVTNKLTTFKVGKACWSKMIDKQQGALHAASFYTGDIVEYAKLVTGDDWSAIESQQGDRDRNLQLVEPMIDAFKSRFALTIAVEGDDCDAAGSSLWLRYWNTIGTTLKQYPPKSGKAFITLNVTPTVRDVTVSVDDSGSTFVITAPRDIEPAAWDDKISKPFRKIARSI